MNIPARLLVPVTVALFGWGAVAAGALSASAAAPRTAPSCTAAQLRVHLGRSSGAAGTTYRNVRFHNTGSSACTLDGYPRFAFLNHSGHRIGFPAVPTGASHPVRIRSGSGAVAALGVPAYQNFPKARCHARHAAAIAVRAPGTIRRDVVTFRATTVCTTRFGRSTALAVRHHF